jgi:hypothetical protein
VLHLFRAPDRQFLQTLAYPEEFHGPVRFLDDSHYLVLGSAISVFDAARYAGVERLDSGQVNFQASAIAPDGSRVYIGSDNPKGVIALQTEHAACSPPQSGLSVFYAADGTFDDSANSWNLSPQGRVHFVPGKVGQAFYFDGSGFLSAASLGHYNGVIDSNDMSFAFYTKLADIDGEQILLDWNAANPSREVRLSRSEDRHFVFETRPGPSLQSESVVSSNTWYHVAITRTDREIALYVNGAVEDHRQAPPPPQAGAEVDFALFLGADTSGRRLFRGLLDEITFYDRALSAKEIRDLYKLREFGPCKM